MAVYFPVVIKAPHHPKIPASNEGVIQILSNSYTPQEKALGHRSPLSSKVLKLTSSSSAPAHTVPKPRPTLLETCAERATSNSTQPTATPHLEANERNPGTCQPFPKHPQILKPQPPIPPPPPPPRVQNPTSYHPQKQPSINPIFKIFVQPQSAQAASISHNPIKEFHQLSTPVSRHHITFSQKNHTKQSPPPPSFK